ncbi:MAG: hypothetical protein NC038_00010 [Paludibacter sp.]|nr:hypothetical protein [Bacteroidales bacterium]MCM1068777.1 hypothetical protein [Prevotella sp.]MCM1354489.1 hypothetical protein [Bacteroides sp.]MCM1443292.1 hypothetical protein [Muribaculum sp.]MCM1481023.1 hypothetical protein [Paludibacter sp.]
MKGFIRIIAVASIFFCAFSACTRVSNKGTNNGTKSVLEQVSERQVNDEGKISAEDIKVITIVSDKVPKQTQTLHVFIENSGSMNGYINSASDFQMSIGKAIQLMKYKYGEENIKTYYINQSVHETQRPEGTDVYSFVQKMLTRKDFTTSGTGKVDKGTASTDLNDIITMVLGYVDENNTAVLISDFIYSLSSTTGVTTSLLYGCQNLTMSAFLQKTKTLPQNTSLATNLIQLYSNFSGKYWHWEKPTGNGYVTLNCSRPYYMCVLGTDDNVRDFNKDVNITELKGYKNQFTISNKDVSKTKYTVFDTKYKRGVYRHGKENAIHSIDKARKNNIGEFAFGIGIDLSDFSMSETDKTDVANYIVKRGNYEIDHIEIIDTLKLPTPIDKKLVRENHCTHAIIVKATGFPNDLSICIRRELPNWIRRTSSIDDRIIVNDTEEQLKTFGIAYFVEGISDAYKYLATDKNNFMTIEVTVSK